MSWTLGQWVEGLIAVGVIMGVVAFLLLLLIGAVLQYWAYRNRESRRVRVGDCWPVSKEWLDGTRSRRTLK